jgi:uncharacterized protein with GYD domain
MPKYMIQARFSEEGLRGLKTQGGTARRAQVEKTIANLGGTLEAYYFAFGAHDAVVIADLPDNVTAAALGMAVGASGAGATSTTPLLTPEEMDRIVRTTVDYSPPGQ